MVAPVVVVVDEGSNGFLQFTGDVVGEETQLSLDGTMIALYLTIGLRMIG
jgi:hypothetical protein